MVVSTLSLCLHSSLIHHVPFLLQFVKTSITFNHRKKPNPARHPARRAVVSASLSILVGLPVCLRSWPRFVDLSPYLSSCLARGKEEQQTKIYVPSSLPSSSSLLSSPLSSIDLAFFNKVRSLEEGRHQFLGEASWRGREISL